MFCRAASLNIAATSSKPIERRASNDSVSVAFATFAFRRIIKQADDEPSLSSNDSSLRPLLSATAQAAWSL